MVIGWSRRPRTVGGAELLMEGEPMQNHSISTYYMNRPVDVPPRVAVAAYDQLIDPEGAPLRAERARLVLAHALPTGTGPTYGPLRSARGVLTTGHHRHPVELELLPWSSRRTELGIRPLGTVFARFPCEPILDAGHQILRLLDELLTDWAHRPLRELLADLQATPVAGTNGHARRP
jgi:hypothetical protein